MKTAQENSAKSGAGAELGLLTGLEPILWGYKDHTEIRGTAQDKLMVGVRKFTRVREPHRMIF